MLLYCIFHFKSLHSIVNNIIFYKLPWRQSHHGLYLSQSVILRHVSAYVPTYRCQFTLSHKPFLTPCLSRDVTPLPEITGVTYFLRMCNTMLPNIGGPLFIYYYFFFFLNIFIQGVYILAKKLFLTHVTRYTLNDKTHY